MVKIIDKREVESTDKFRNLEIGQCFQDDENFLCMKVSETDLLRYINGGWRNNWVTSPDSLVIPLKTTIMVEGETE